MDAKNKRLIGIVLVVMIMLSVPLVAMKFTNEVKWSGFDFVIAGVLLLGTGLLCEFVLRKVKRWEYRIALCAAILFALFIVWAELAVGLIGTPFAGS